MGECSAWFSTDADRRDYLEWLRWPGGFVCPRCEQAGGWRTADGRLMCTARGARSSPTAGTIFDRTRTPLTLWFTACWLFATQKDGISALSLKRSLEIGSYQTAWAMLHRVRSALAASNTWTSPTSNDTAALRFRGDPGITAEASETPVGGRPRSAARAELRAAGGRGPRTVDLARSPQPRQRRRRAAPCSAQLHGDGRADGGRRHDVEDFTRALPGGRVDHRVLSRTGRRALARLRRRAGRRRADQERCAFP